ncbi:hypothetical protein CRUP_029094 [Coryphaenoides rupestris]|nr:hypothetical protein CRUP_029094 [Coryphaenoides rupestris]
MPTKATAMHKQSDSERKGFMEKLYAIQDVCVSVQNALGEVASYGERIKNTFNWTVPFVTWLVVLALSLACVQYYELKLDPSLSPNKRRKNTPG